MNWDAVAAVGAIGGALAVVASLVYVARQVRANTAAVRSAAYAAISGDLASTLSSISQDQRVSHLFRRIVFDGASTEDLDPDERMRLGMALLSLLNIWQNAFIQAEREGLFEFTAVTGMFSSAVTNSVYFREFWARNRMELKPGFVEFFERHQDAVGRGDG